MERTNIETREKILTMRATGYSFANIARECNVAKQTAVDVCKTEREALANMEAMRWEELYIKHRITAEERIKAHALLLERIRAEIEHRNLAEVPTDRLILLYVKISEQLQAEMIRPTYSSTEEQENGKHLRHLANMPIK